ncbi:MAG: response regulator [Anaerolineae bacterium]|nr:response regulator [Anaerolineae bacterium]MCO5188401.1 response regulator [Anaerolineae bacterium]MCO5194838.1 response regulator [Anaerolineae bacterium]MCO5198430.1 response regulator [Anaerolineae bacterium]MCO5205882.1 response regulator [Anaerolineae bacterium]
MSETKILIMDRHAEVRKALAKRLQSVDYYQIVGAVADVPSLLRQIRQTQPDIVLYGLHTTHGVKLSSSLYDIQQVVHTGVDVIVLSPFIDEVERDLILQAGAKRYLLKHINTPHLIQEIDILHPVLL